MIRRIRRDFEALKCLSALQVQLSVCPTPAEAAAAAYMASVHEEAAVACDFVYGCDAAMEEAAGTAEAYVAASDTQQIAAVACSTTGCNPLTIANASLAKHFSAKPSPTTTPKPKPRSTTTPTLMTTPIPEQLEALNASQGVSGESNQPPAAPPSCTFRLGPLLLPQPPAVGIVPGIFLSLPAGMSPPAIGLAAYQRSLLCSPGYAGAAAGVTTGPLPYPDVLDPEAGTNDVPTRVALDGRLNLAQDAVIVDGCALCAPGSFSAVSGQTACEQCPPGSFMAGTGATVCIECAAGEYQPHLNSTACVRCTADVAETLWSGSVSVTACFGAQIVVERVWLIGQASNTKTCYS